MLKNISFVLKTSQDYIRYTGEDAVANEALLSRLFDDVSDIYIPLLNMFSDFENKGIQTKIGLVLAPVLCTMLESETVQDLYIEWLNKRIELGKTETERNSDNNQILELVKVTENKYISLKSDFEEKYCKNLIGAFSSFAQKGFIEIIATCGTDIFIPHFADLPEVISAQIETGLQSFRHSFGEIPEGFWLPELGYVPGVEKLIRAYGFSYTIVDARAVLLCQNIPSKGIFHPYRFENSLAVFAADSFLNEQIYGDGSDNDSGYSLNPVYRNENCDIGFELSSKELSGIFGEGNSRFPTGYKYWNKDSDDEDKYLYDLDAATKQAVDDAKDFVANKKDLLERAAAELPDTDFVSLVCALDVNKLKNNWGEGLFWIEQILSTIATDSNSGLTLVNPKDMLENQFVFEKVNPYYSAAAGTGYGENLISSSNSWMMRYIRKSCERMIDLSDRFPNDTGLKTRLLNIGAKELMIAQSDGLLKMIDEKEFPEFAEKRFKDSISAFTAVFDSLGSNKVSTEWLTTLETKDNLFPWMNYRIFSKKK